MSQDIKQAVDTLREYSNWYKDETSNRPTMPEIMKALNTVLEYVEIDFMVEELSAEGCCCCEGSEDLGSLH